MKPPRRTGLFGVTSGETGLPDIDQPFGGKPSGGHCLKEKRSRGQRVLDGPCGVRVGGRSQAASNTPSFEIGIRSDTAMIPLDIEPPPLTVVTHGKYHLLRVSISRGKTSEIKNRPAARPLYSTRSFPPAYIAPKLVVNCFVSLLFGQTRHECLVREISTQNYRAHIAMSYDPTIAWKASPTRTPPPICTSVPILKPRWS
jgi:hypothetical protein